MPIILKGPIFHCTPFKKEQELDQTFRTTKEQLYQLFDLLIGVLLSIDSAQMAGTIPGTVVLLMGAVSIYSALARIAMALRT